MKNIIILLFFLSFFSCKKGQESISNKVNSNETTIDKNWNGDTLISDINFINSINSSCKLNTAFFDRSEKQIKKDNEKCALSKIKFNYEKLDSLKNKVIVGKLNSEIELFINKSQSKNSENADLSYQTTLYVEKNKIILDSIVIYQSFNYSEALTVKTKYYYLNKDNIYLLDFAEDESGSSADKWEHYKINSKGKISLIKQNLFSQEDNSNNVEEVKNDFWKGKYYFEASNKDDVKTIFDITINSLNNISINVTEEGIKKEYSNIKAEKINSEKIKITYDNSSDDMGIIYIEKSDDNYFISGNPIYFINPGNNEMPLKKIK